MVSLGYRLCYWTLYAISLLPMALLYQISTVIFFLTYRVFGYRRLVVIQNIARAFPGKKYVEIQSVVGQFYRYFAHLLVENIKAISASDETLHKKLVFENLEIMVRYTYAGQNVIGCLGHCGNWELLGLMASNVPNPTYAIYIPLKSTIADRLIKTVRSRFGMKLISHRLAARHILCKDSDPAIFLFLADQCPAVTDNQFKFNFLNQETYFVSGMEKLARSIDAAVVYLHVTALSRGKYKIKCEAISSNAASTGYGEITRKYAELLSKNIQDEPHSWLWTHRRWKK